MSELCDTLPHIASVQTLARAASVDTTFAPMKTDAIRARLLALKTSELKKLSEKSGVAIRAIWRLRSGETAHATERTADALSPLLRRVKPVEAQA